MSPVYWLEGPVEGIPLLLQPAAHALLDARDDCRAAAASLTLEQTWQRPNNAAASVGFHLRHLAGSLDRLISYGQGQELTEAQQKYLAEEKTDPSPLIPPAVLLAHVDQTISRALDAYRQTDEGTLLQERLVGRARKRSNVLGLFFHAAEHTQRHTGQVVTTAKIISAAKG